MVGRSRNRQHEPVMDSVEHPNDSPGTLVIVGTGIQWAGQATGASRRAIEEADRVFFAVADPFTVRWIRELNPSAESLPYPRDGSARIDTYLDMVERVLAAVRKGAQVCAAFYGHPGVLTTPGHELLRAARRDGLSAHMLPGISSLDCLYADLGVDPGRQGCQIYAAEDWLVRSRRFDVHTPLILCQPATVGNDSFCDTAAQAQLRHGLTLLAEALCRHYPPAHRLVLYEAASLPIKGPRIEPIAITQLPDAAVSALTTLYIPAIAQAPIDADMKIRLTTGALNTKGDPST